MHLNRTKKQFSILFQRILGWGFMRTFTSIFRRWIWWKQFELSNGRWFPLQISNRRRSLLAPSSCVRRIEMLGSIYVNSRILRAVTVSRSRSVPVSTGGFIKIPACSLTAINYV